MSRHPTRIGAVLLAGALLAGCGEDSDPTSIPTPGQILVTLATPNADDGSALLQVTGPGFTAARPTSVSSEIFWRLSATGEIRVIVLGGLASGPILAVDVPDVGRAGAYSATLLEVAATDDVLRGDLSTYSIAVEPGSD